MSDAKPASIIDAIDASLPVSGGVVVMKFDDGGLVDVNECWATERQDGDGFRRTVHDSREAAEQAAEQNGGVVRRLVIHVFEVEE